MRIKPGTAGTAPSTPSWIPDWDTGPFQDLADIAGSTDRWDDFSASGGLVADVRCYSRKPLILLAKGALVDRVAHLGPDQKEN